jgi:hypothetical protein
MKIKNIKKIKINNTKRRGSKHLNQYGGIFRTLSDYAISTWNAITSAWVSTPLTIFNITRMSVSIIEDTNHAYHYYRYATTIDVDKLHLPQVTKDRFLEAKHKLNEMLVYIKNSKIGIRLCGIAYANYTKNQSAYDREVAALNEIEESTSNTLHPTRIKQIFDVGMVTFYGDWYRYELNILLTRLVAVVNEIIASFVRLPRIGDMEPNTQPFISISHTTTQAPEVASTMRSPPVANSFNPASSLRKRRSSSKKSK